MLVEDDFLWVCPSLIELPACLVSRGVLYAYTSLHVLSLILRMNDWHDFESQGLAAGNTPMELSVCLTRPS